MKIIAIFISYKGRILNTLHKTLTVNHPVTQWRFEPWYEQSGRTKGSLRFHRGIRLNGLLHVWWCMSCIILLLQQQTWLL